MPQNTNVPLNNASWAQITDANVTAIRIQNLSTYPVLLMGTAGEVTPTGTAGAIRLGAGQTLAADVTLAQLWPGVAATRVYGLIEYPASLPVSAAVSISHA